MLESACLLEIPQDLRWEILMIDNGDDDPAAEIVAAYRQRIPVRRIVEPVAGLSHARNAGIDEARGALLCWTDDDVVLPSDWLAIYWRASRAFPDVVVFGGRIVPEAEAPLTDWFAAQMLEWPLSALVAHRDLGDAPIPLLPRSDRVPWGANYAIRAADQQSLRYDPALRSGEEVELVWRLLRSGRRGRWLPESRVTHVIPRERQSRSYVAAYYRRAGRTAACLGARYGADNPVAPGVPAWTRCGDSLLALLALAAAAMAKAAQMARGPGSGLRWLARASYLQGIRDFRRSSARSASASP
jgi:glycosyltransferase involved in cell wall biosynthesis